MPALDSMQFIELCLQQLSATLFMVVPKQCVLCGSTNCPAEGQGHHVLPGGREGLDM